MAQPEVNTSIVNKKKQTPLHTATNPLVVAALLEHIYQDKPIDNTAVIDAKDTDGKTALATIIERKSNPFNFYAYVYHVGKAVTTGERPSVDTIKLEISKMLLDRGANIDVLDANSNIII